ncbi:MAG TPA: secretion system X translation initiation factor [Pelomicrobium sp.]|nr:secretion system X translation initiation factor [Pelomicrobium sp.]
MKTPRPRHVFLGAALALTLLATATQSSRKDGPSADVVEPVARPERGAAAPRAAEQPVLDLEALNRRAAPPPGADLFGSRSWYTPPPPPPPVVAAPPPLPPKPTAPPLPFRYVGRLAETGEEGTYFLSRGDDLVTVRAGDVIDDTYRVDAISGGAIEFTYIPLQQKQTLAIGRTE